MCRRSPESEVTEATESTAMQVVHREVRVTADGQWVVAGLTDERFGV
jgi:hypothetical protein